MKVCTGQTLVLRVVSFSTRQDVVQGGLKKYIYMTTPSLWDKKIMTTVLLLLHGCMGLWRAAVELSSNAL